MDPPGHEDRLPQPDRPVGSDTRGAVPDRPDSRVPDAKRGTDAHPDRPGGGADRRRLPRQATLGRGVQGPDGTVREHSAQLPPAVRGRRPRLLGRVRDRPVLSRHRPSRAGEGDEIGVKVTASLIHFRCDLYVPRGWGRGPRRRPRPRPYRLPRHRPWPRQFRSKSPCGPPWTVACSASG